MCGVLSRSAMATGAPSHSAMCTGGPSHSAMATGAPSHSAMCTGSPSHSAGFLMATSAGLPMGTTRGFSIFTIFNYFSNCCFFLSYSITSNPPAVISLNHTFTGQVAVNGTSSVSATSNHQTVDRRSRGAFSSHIL